MKYFKSYKSFLAEGLQFESINESTENSKEDLVGKIGDLDSILLYSSNKNAQKEWDKISSEYLESNPNIEYWSDLGEFELLDAIESALLLMKKYNIKESLTDDNLGHLNEELYDFVRDIESALGRRAPRWQIEDYLGRKLSSSELSALGMGTSSSSWGRYGKGYGRKWSYTKKKKSFSPTVDASKPLNIW